MWWRVLMVLVILVLASCAMGGGSKEKTPLDPAKLEQLIKAARKAGCVVKGVQVDVYMETVNIICH